jgi:hypothetical protein
MKIIKRFTFATLAALAVALVVQASVTRADDEGQQEQHGQQAKITFTKWVTALPNQPGLIANMEGIVSGGDAGPGTFVGEVLKWDTSGPVIDIVAVYHFTGSKQAFTAVVHATRPKTSPDGVIVGVVTDGWLKGHALEGEWTAIAPCYPSGAGVGNCLEVTLSIARDSKDSIDN